MFQSKEFLRGVIWGCGAHAASVVDLIASCPQISLAGILVDSAWRHSCRESLRPLLQGGLESCQMLVASGISHALVAVGDNRQRVEAAASLERNGMTLFSVVHPTAYVSSSAMVSAGTVIGPNAVVNTGAVVGKNCIVNSGAIVEHDCILCDGVHISPGAKLAGQVRVGECTWIGIGATVIEKISIGRGTVVGAGSVVVEDLPGNIVAYGVPARVRRNLST